MSDQRRIVYSVIEYDPLLDSSNMTVDDYAQVAVDIKVGAMLVTNHLRLNSEVKYGAFLIPVYMTYKI